MCSSDLNGTISVVFGAGVTGRVTDTTHTDNIASGSKINWSVAQTAGGAGQISFGWRSSVISSAYQASPQYAARTSGVSINSATTYYEPIGATSGSSATTTEAQVQYKLGSATTWSNLYAYINSNTLSGGTPTLTFTGRKSATNLTNTVSFASAETGLKEDTTHSDSLAAADLVDFSVVSTGTTGSASYNYVGVRSASAARNLVLDKRTSSISATTYYADVEGDGWSTSESSYKYYFPTASSMRLQNAQTYATAYTATVTWTLRQNGADAAIVVTNSGTGLAEDTTHTVTYAAGDLINWKVVAGGAGATFSFAGIEATQIVVTTVSPAAGSLTTSLKTPTLKSTIKPAAGSLTLTGQTPSVLLVTKITPAAGALTTSLKTPTLQLSVKPAAGALTVTGQTPTLKSTLRPAAGSLALTGQTPTLKSVLRPAAGALTLTGQTPTLKATLRPAAGALTLTGQTPTLTSAIKPAAGSLTLTGQTPTVTIVAGDVTVAPAAASLTLTGQSDTLISTLHPAAASLALTGSTPTLKSTIRPAAGALTLTGSTPTLALSMSPAAGSLTLTGETPVLSTTINIRPSAGALVLTGTTPTLKSTVRPAAGSLTLTGETPIVIIAFVVSPAAGALTTATSTPTLKSIVRPAAGALVLTGRTPTITYVYRYFPAAGSLVLTGEKVGFAGSISSTETSTQVLLGYASSSASVSESSTGVALRNRSTKAMITEAVI